MRYIYNKNKDDSGNHEVHIEGCQRSPLYGNQVSIKGLHENCHSAISQVKQDTGKTNFDGCYYCSTACHSS